MFARGGLIICTMRKFPVERSSSRTRIRQSISFELSELEADRPEIVVTRGFGVDICDGGMGLITRYPLKAGAVLKIYFPVAAAKASLPVYSEVVWSKPTDGEYRAGLRFLA